MKTCQGCQNRHAGCHDDCPIYAEFKQEKDKERETRFKTLQTERLGRKLISSRAMKRGC